MHITAATIQGYRSVRNLTLPIEACSVFVGANGVGKTNLYRALALQRGQLHAPSPKTVESNRCCGLVFV